MKDYFVYILECNDGRYYTGVTSELEKRVNEHNSGFYKGYTSSRLPVKLVIQIDLQMLMKPSTQRNKLKDGAELKRKH